MAATSPNGTDFLPPFQVSPLYLAIFAFPAKYTTGTAKNYDFGAEEKTVGHSPCWGSLSIECVSGLQFSVPLRDG
ncbi:hypothetical protein SUGI_0213830 [Cryptomeria japonica]|nr:hypothetical protein SUGI_0213830 [Cryptomeria japonica]